MNKWLLRIFATVLLLCAVIALAYAFRAPLLRATGKGWIVNDTLTKADGVVVLGGGVQTRPFEAARLLQSGLAPRILLTTPQAAPTGLLGLSLAEPELARRILQSKNVPAPAIALVPGVADNTYEEACAVRDWAKKNQMHKLILITDAFQSRRARWVFRKELKPLGIQIEIDAMAAREYTVEDWWRHEQGLIAFQNEVIKYFYYRWKY
jgi:uncharacterized SAM-binding protein YcdF (DUF218 family)